MFRELLVSLLRLKRVGIFRMQKRFANGAGNGEGMI